MKKVLVTGASGCVGRYCLPLLVKGGYEVNAVYLKNEPIDHKEVIWHRVDLLDRSQTSELISKISPSHLLHLAWIATPREFWNSLENLRWAEASLHLFREFADRGGQRVVAAGSCAEYEWKQGYCVEGNTPLRPATLYGATKHGVQCILKAFAAEAKISAGWGRVFFVYGPHEHPEKLVAYVIRQLLRREPARCSHGEQVRDFLYVKDVADAFIALLQSQVSGPVNIGSGTAITLKELILKIAELLDGKDLIRLSTLATPNEPEIILADVRRLRDEVGWSPSWSLVDGLRQSIDWWEPRI